jgi:hypothetical protein
MESLERLYSPKPNAWICNPGFATLRLRLHIALTVYRNQIPVGHGLIPDE